MIIQFIKDCFKRLNFDIYFKYTIIFILNEIRKSLIIQTKLKKIIKYSKRI